MSQVVLARKARAKQLATLHNERNGQKGETSNTSRNFSGNYGGYLEKRTLCCKNNVKEVSGNKKSSENHVVARLVDCDKKAKVSEYKTTRYEKKIINPNPTPCKIINRVVGQTYALIGNPVERCRTEVVRNRRTITSGDRIQDLKNKAIQDSRDRLCQ